MFDLIHWMLQEASPIPAPTIPDAPDLSWLGPTITGIAAVLVGLVGAISLVWRRRQDRRDAAVDKAADAEIAIAPKVTDGWEEVRMARAEASAYYNLYRTFENLFYMAFGALRHLARSTRDAHPETVFDQDIVDALAIVPPDTSDAKK